MRLVLTFFLALILTGAIAQKTDKKLQAQLQQLIIGFKGDIGMYVHDLKHNKIAEVNADTIFPTASIVKIPILIGIMQKIEKGELSTISLYCLLIH